MDEVIVWEKNYAWVIFIIIVITGVCSKSILRNMKCNSVFTQLYAYIIYIIICTLYNII